MNMTPSAYAKEYLDRLNLTIGSLPLESLDSIVNTIHKTYLNRKQIFIIGNGGSASTASHMMNDLNKGTLGHNGDAPWPRFRAIALTDNISLITAWANDADYKLIYSEPLRNLAEPGDLLIAISASGNSPNIVQAVSTAKELGVTVIGLSGFGGGKLLEMADACFVVPSKEYGPVEDIHMILDHIITGYLFDKLKHSATIPHE